MGALLGGASEGANDSIDKGDAPRGVDGDGSHPGRLVVIGLQGGVKGELNLNALLGKCATVTATSLRFRPASEKAEICAAVASDVWPMVADGRIRLARETRVPFAEVQRAHELLESGDNVGKIILTL